MTGPTIEQGKAGIKHRLEEFLRGRTDIGLTDVKRYLINTFAGTRTQELVYDGRFVAKMLNAVGWRRDGWLYTGYDRTPRYVPAESEAR